MSGPGESKYFANYFIYSQIAGINFDMGAGVVFLAFVQKLVYSLRFVGSPQQGTLVTTTGPADNRIYIGHEVNN